MQWSIPALSIVWIGCLDAPPGSIEKDAGGDADAHGFDCPDLAPLEPFSDDLSTDALDWVDGVEVRFELAVNVQDADGGDRGMFVIDDLDLPPCSG